MKKKTIKIGEQLLKASQWVLTRSDGDVVTVGSYPIFDPTEGLRHFLQSDGNSKRMRPVRYTSCLHDINLHPVGV